MSAWLIGLIVLGAAIWLVGAFTVTGDLLENGKSLKDYREKYGHDLGLLICCTYRGAAIFAWPAVGFVGFIFGTIRDIIKLVLK